MQIHRYSCGRFYQLSSLLDLKLAKMDSVLVLGSVEDERCFSALKFFKSYQRNRLGKHLPLAARIFGQKFFIKENNYRIFKKVHL